LLPISLTELAKKEELPADKTKKLEILKEFYDKYATKEYNPTLETPGFRLPNQVIVQYLTADASMPYFKAPAEALSRLEKMPPMAPNPLTPLASVLGMVAKAPAYTTSLELGLKQDRTNHEADLLKHRLALERLSFLINQPIPEKGDKAQFILEQMEYQKQYEKILNEKPTYKYGLSGLLTPYFWNHDLLVEAEKKPKATTVAAALGALARPDGGFAAVAAYRTAAYDDQSKRWRRMLAMEKNQRIEAGAELFLAQAPTQAPTLFGASLSTAAGMAYYAGNKEQYTPVAGFLEDELRTKVE